ncbi:uncharacterized protein B0H64DRAFT_354468 [Chaetomium fimeti]|uniref:Uncharacterized protein n=1 Tax=Chaetomium fimeti TaxID=1854472 RepID=A0AAE0HLM3_9PEZI|nr:hypothetical protein B0H64DRAFT_354468 [Chaetomium fimeti]
MVSIAHGLWWDHSKPAALAPTLTLSVDSGNILLSGLTFLVTIAGASCWSIVAFILHHRKAKAGPVSALDLQYRVSLRNSAGAARTLWEAFQIHQAWSPRRPQKLIWRTLSVAIPALVVSACFTVAALFTSRVANKAYGPTIARAEAHECGFWDFSSTIDAETASLFTAKSRDVAARARTHAASFYTNSTTSSVLSTFVQPTLPYEVDTSARCPIPASERCVPGVDKAFSITSGYLDSHEMLGINARFEDRVSLQLQTTCSPVDVADLAQRTADSQGSFIEYPLGAVLEGIGNITHRYNVALANNTGLGYTLHSFRAFASDAPPSPLSNWLPIPALTRPDADVSILLLTPNDMRYTAPVHDPWFSANGTYNFTLDNHLYTFADRYLSPLICADQYRLCNPSSHICTPPAGILQLTTTHLTQHAPLQYTAVQTATAARLLVSLAEINTFTAVSALGGADALRAQRLAVGNVSPALPADQWRAEVEGWFQMNLARLQAEVVEFAVKGGSPLLEGAGRRLGMLPLSREQREQCGNQLVRAVGEVQNFSLVGVLVVVCVCVVLVVVDLLLERVVDLVGARFRGRRPASWSAADARQADGKLHLLRVALAAASGEGKDWKLGRWSVPVTGRGEGVERFDTSTHADPNGLATYVQFGQGMVEDGEMDVGR